MPDYILFMHDDAPAAIEEREWTPYLDGLQAAGVLRGGSAIGAGACYRRTGPAGAETTIVGFVRVEADTLEAATAYLASNPVYEAGGTVEVRVLPRTN